MLLCLFLFQLRIRKTGVVDGLQLLDEDSLGVGDVTEGDGTLLEVAFADLGIDETVDEFANGLLRVVGE